MKKIQAIFLDRDGTIGGGDEVILPREFSLYPSAKLAINFLIQWEIPIFSFTNQPDISKGCVDIKDFKEELLDFGFKDVFICPHAPEENCECRKPKTGMLKNAELKYNLDLTKAIIIGDRYTDMLSAEQVGALKILVKTGCGMDSLENKQWDSNICDYIAEDLLDAVNWIRKLLPKNTSILEK